MHYNTKYFLLSTVLRACLSRILSLFLPKPAEIDWVPNAFEKHCLWQSMRERLYFSDALCYNIQQDRTARRFTAHLEEDRHGHTPGSENHSPALAAGKIGRCAALHNRRDQAAEDKGLFSGGGGLWRGSQGVHPALGLHPARGKRRLLPALCLNMKAIAAGIKAALAAIAENEVDIVAAEGKTH